MSKVVLEATDLVKEYRIGRHRERLRAVDGVSLSVGEGEILGVVGESGCGKSTTARMLVGIDAPSSGQVKIEDVPLTSMHRLDVARGVQMVFQNPYASLNPRMTVDAALMEVLRVHRRVGSTSARRMRAREILRMVGLSEHFAHRYPHQMSGGQRQRVAVARALAAEPRVIVLDEAASALDVSVQAEVIDLLLRLRDDLGLAYVFISHDLGVVRYVSDRIAVMYLGRVVEVGGWRDVFDRPLHPYTYALQTALAIPALDEEDTDGRWKLRGEVPDPANPPDACRFHPRCPLAESRCQEVDPAVVELLPGHFAACHVMKEAVEQGQSPQVVLSRGGFSRRESVE